MSSLHLIPSIHRQQPIVSDDFRFDKDFIGLIQAHGSGTGLYCIQELLGYNSIKTMERYTQVSTQEIGTIVNPLTPITKKEWHYTCQNGVY